MKLDENFTIESDSNCWTLNLRILRPIDEVTGKAPVYEKQTFHASLKQALRAYFDEKLKTTELIPENILKIGEAIETVYSQIESLPSIK
jgi:hypothetical protein